MADGTFDTTGSGLYTPEAPPASAADAQEVSDEQLLAQYRRQFEEVTEPYPAGAVLTAMGLGVGLGAALGFALGRASKSGTPVQDESELIGRRLLAAVRDVVPDGVARYLD